MPDDTRVYVEPTDEQLAAFVCVSVMGAGYSANDQAVAAGLLEISFVRACWLHRHRELQEAVWRFADEVDRA